MIRRVLVATLLVVPAAAAQAPSASLDRADSLVAIGVADRARAELMTWWSKSAGGAGRAELQRAIWLRAVLTVDPAQAAVDYQRLVVEYPGGAYSDRALLRLAQASEARGDTAKARSQLRSLLRDYPSGPARADAALLLESVAGPQAAPGEGQPIPPVTREPSPEMPSDRVALEPAAAGAWTVQLGAFASSERARALGREIAAGGDATRVVVVPPSRLVRVRTGRFLSQAAAERACRDLIARGLDATVAADADREEIAP